MKPFYKSKSWIIFIALLLVVALHFLVSISSANSQKPFIDALSVETDKEDLVISAILKNGFTQEVIEAVNSGLTTTFSFHIELKSLRPFWFDMDIVSRTIKHTVKYNTILKEYTFVSQDDKGQNSKATRNFDQAVKWMEDVDHIHVVPLSLLEPGNSYYIRIKAQMESTSLLIPLKRLLFFVPFGNFETNWVNSSSFILKILLTKERPW